MTIKTILCPVDFFPASDSAVRYAIKLSSGFRAKIHLLHVIPPVARGAYVPYNKEIIKLTEESSTRELKKIAARIRAAGVFVETTVRIGDVYDEINRAIDVIKPQLLVLGTHGRTGVNRWFMGSTTERLLRHCPIPVITISARSGSTVSAGKPRRILVTTDFSHGTADALTYAFSIAQKHSSEIILLHVVDDIVADVCGNYRAILIQGVQKQLDDLVPPDVRNWCNIVSRVATGRASRIIPKVLRTEMIDLLVMNIHGKTMLDRAMIGSTAERIVRAAKCPVMLVPAMKRKPKEAQRPSRKQTAAA